MTLKQLKAKARRKKMTGKLTTGKTKVKKSKSMKELTLENKRLNRTKELMLENIELEKKINGIVEEEESPELESRTYTSKEDILGDIHMIAYSTFEDELLIYELVDGGDVELHSIKAKEVNSDFDIEIDEAEKWLVDNYTYLTNNDDYGFYFK